MDASSTSSQNEMDFIEQEYHSLRRQYRIMEGDRNTYQQKAQHHISRQQRLIDRLRQEEEDLTTDLLLAQSNTVQKKDSTNLSEIKKLSSAQQTYNEVVRNEKTTAETLKQKVKELEFEIEAQTKINGSTISQHKNHVDRLKKIRVLENRHNTATVQFNKLLTENTCLRESIEHYRNQRKVFNTLYRRLTAKLQAQKTQISSVIDDATIHYDQRDEALTKMISLHERNDQDLNHFISEYKEMNRVIAHESGLLDFMNTKNSELSELALTIEKERSCGRAVKAEHVQEEEMIKFEKVLGAIINVLGTDQGKKLTDILDSPEANEKVDTLCEAIQPVCDRYRKTEEQNYSLFQFVNEMSQDVKRLEEKISSLSVDNEKEQHDHQAQIGEVNEQVDCLQKHLNVHEELANDMVGKCSADTEELGKLEEHVISLFSMLKCDDSEIIALLDSKGKINDQTLEIYLSVIENRINSLVEWQTLTTIDTDEKEGRGGNKTPKTPASRQKGRDTVVTKGSKKRGDQQNILQSYDFIDSNFNDLDATPFSETSLGERAQLIIEERIRLTMQTPRTPKTPRTPMPRSRSKDN